MGVERSGGYEVKKEGERKDGEKGGRLAGREGGKGGREERWEASSQEGFLMSIVAN